jgi:hypothetical protein
MLPLDDPLWDSLKCHNISGREFAATLARYFTAGVPESDDLYEDLFQCACGGDVYDSCYAAAPHLVKLAKSCPPDPAATLLGFVVIAIVEAAIGGAEIDGRLTAPLGAVREEGLAIAPAVFAAAGLDHPDRRYFEAHLRGFQGDFEGYSKLLAEIDASDDTALERMKEVRDLNDSGRVIPQVYWGADDSKSWTTNAGT